MILAPLQKLPYNVGDLGKIIVAIGFEWLAKVQKNAKSGNTGRNSIHLFLFLKVEISKEVFYFLFRNFSIIFIYQLPYLCPTNGLCLCFLKLNVLSTTITSKDTFITGDDVISKF